MRGYTTATYPQNGKKWCKRENELGQKFVTLIQVIQCACTKISQSFFSKIREQRRESRLNFARAKKLIANGGSEEENVENAYQCNSVARTPSQSG